MPCEQFTVTTSTLNPSYCAECEVLVAGNDSTNTFDAVTTGQFEVKLCLSPDCRVGPALVYAFETVEDFAQLVWLESSPGHVSEAFQPSTLAYYVYTAYNTLSIEVEASEGSLAFINGSQTTNVTVALSLGAPEEIFVQLQPNGLQCYSPNRYNIVAEQCMHVIDCSSLNLTFFIAVVVEIETLTSSTNLIFSPSIYTYSFASTAMKISLAGTAHLGTACTLTSGAAVQNISNCAVFASTVFVPSTSYLTVFPAYDDSPTQTTYTFTVSTEPISSKATVAIVAASVGAVFLAGTVVVAVGVFKYLRRKHGERMAKSYLSSDSAPLFTDGVNDHVGVND
jgi:hypothetical protein